MNTMQSPTPEFFAASLRVKPSAEAPAARPAYPKNDQLPDRRSWLGQLAPLAFARYLIVFFIGVAAALAWQSYGGAARQMIAPAASSPNEQQFTAISLDLDALRQGIDRIATSSAASQERTTHSLEQLAAGQEWMTRDFNSKLEAVEHDILDKISVPPPRPAPAPPRPPVQRPPQVPAVHSSVPQAER
jgi:hypothetical protein